MTERQRRLLEILDRAVTNGGVVHTYRAVDSDGWFYPIDLGLGLGRVAAQLQAKGILERKDVGYSAPRWIYRRVLKDTL